MFGCFPTTRKFKPGDKVRVKTHLEKFRSEEDPDLIPEMKYHEGEIVTISHYSPDNYPMIVEDNNYYFWYDEWFEPISTLKDPEVSDITMLIKGELS